MLKLFFLLIDRDPCHMNPCSHQGVCIPEGQEYRCECGTGWSGKGCDCKCFLLIYM